MVPNILIVDDVPANLVALKALLRGLDTDVNVVSANSGEEALEKVLEHEFALILTDVQMPEMDGFELASILQDHEEWNQIPIIFITAAYKDEQNRDRGYSAGAVDYIQKPIEEHILLSKVTIFLKLYEQREYIKSVNADLERRVADRTAELQQTQALAKIGGWKIDPSTQNENLSRQAICILSGKDMSEVEGGEISSLFDLMSEEDRNFYKKKIMQLGETVGGQYEFEVELHNLVGQQCHLFCTVEFKYEDGRLSSINGAIQDITERQRAEEIIQYLEMHDPLTTLPNRNSFQEQMLGFLADARLDVEQLAVMVIDLDRFKDVNDTHGQAVADLFLTEVGVRLSDQISQYESLFRVGGDEFAIVCRGIDDMNDVAEKAEEILNVVNQEFRYFDESISLTASVGIAIFPQDADDVDSLLRCADLALQRSKQTIGSTYHFYDAEMSKIFHRRKEQEIRLHHAINESQFELHYQPKIDLRNSGFVGVEALVRWNDPELGTVKPDEFIPLAEETGQIGKLGRWIIQEACGAADRLRKELGFDVPIAINVSVEQIKCPNLSEFIKKTMDEHGIGPELLEIEITETSFLEDISLTGATLADLRKMNLDIALDDFGTGYSSLTHLKNMLATSLKIDRSFIQNIMTEPSDSHIADMIINVAHRLDMRVVAEGIEEQAQVEKLIDLNCDIGQGYYFSRPLPERELVKWYHAFKG